MTRKAAYVPERGDAVWITLDPQAGHEQAGRRPALVLSPSAYNGRVGLAVFCPITSQVKGYPFEVPLPAGSPLTGVVGADQVKSLDWRSRKATRIGAISEEVIAQVLQRAGFLGSVAVEAREGHPSLLLGIRYDEDGRPLIDGIRRVSKPGRRVYVGRESVPRVRNGLGLAVLSTSRGVISDREAREQKLGGELLCEVW